jgi:hypothetical protein
LFECIVGLSCSSKDVCKANIGINCNDTCAACSIAINLYRLKSPPKKPVLLLQWFLPLLLLCLGLVALATATIYQALAINAGSLLVVGDCHATKPSAPTQATAVDVPMRTATMVKNYTFLASWNNVQHRQRLRCLRSPESPKVPQLPTMEKFHLHLRLILLHRFCIVICIFTTHRFLSFVLKMK